MSSELPGEWGERLGPKGIHSYRDMATAVGDGVATATVYRLVVGSATSAATVNKVADALFDGDRDLVWRLRGSRRKDHGDWDLPAEASLLTEEQRAAVVAVVKAMVPAEQDEGGEGHAAGGAASQAPKAGPVVERATPESDVRLNTRRARRLLTEAQPDDADARRSDSNL